ncbi:2-keto-4-pentenoate hydratase [Roseomonas sp. AR75]|jgi:2-keto-4-pentenoate hydratase|uniref:2-keto-4-pentenoate hydratase n=1 Tax=Roseomonas sp. AR75 TaxID=2562311 RepID=UPI0010C0D938|nr:fumarylacetoacetate hydrolase family protein [Roseomonas sp. AR75]
MTSAAAEAILAARRERRILLPLGPAAPADVAAGYAAQREIAEALGAVPPAGFKIGATTKQMQAYLGLSGPAAGFVPEGGVQRSPGSFRYADLIGPGVECEVGLRLGTDLPAGPCTRDQAAAAVAEVFAAIEIVEKRYTDLAELGTPTLVADQVFHRAGVLGPAAPGWRAADLGAIRGRITVDGALRGEGVGADLLGHPFEALAWLAASPAAAVFGGLRAGQVVFLGSVTPPIWLDGPCHVTVEFDVLGRAEAKFA